MSNENFFKRIATALKDRENPTDLKPCLIYKVVELNPITLQSSDESVLLVENEELQISEWFSFRCNIDKTGALSKTVPNELQTAEQVQETHSFNSSPCDMPTAIEDLASAIQSVCSELLNLKCNLQIGDFVIVASLEETDKFILVDKV